VEQVSNSLDQTLQGYCWSYLRSTLHVTLLDYPGIFHSGCKDTGESAYSSQNPISYQMLIIKIVSVKKKLTETIIKIAMSVKKNICSCSGLQWQQQQSAAALVSSSSGQQRQR
jgi:hypothetical protein